MRIGKTLNLKSPRPRDALIILLGKKRGRSISVFDDDIFITSYPKSGNTWLRFLVGCLVYGNELHGFSNIEEKVPDIYLNKEDKLINLERPRILKSHEYFDPRYRNVICLVRDPRDVVLSYYSFHKKVGFIHQNYPIETYVKRFISGDLDRYGTWQENVGSWLGARKNSKQFLLVRYEDLLTNTEAQLSKVASFINIQTDREAISRAVEFSSARNMKKLEREQNDEWLPTKNSRKDIEFVRSAKAKSWQSQLPLVLARDIEAAWSQLMKELEYL